MSMRLYSYWRSSAAYRVRIALNLKELDYEIVPISLLGEEPEHRQSAFQRINPQMLVPFFDDGEVAIGQSMAILEYLEETQTDVPLLPDDPGARARIRSFCNSICCDIHPLNNLRVMKYLKGELSIGDDAYLQWYAHWIHEGFRSAEAFASYAGGGDFVHGKDPTLADCCLVPQVYNARRFKVPLDEFPTLVRITDACNELDAFQDAAPECQPDAIN